MMMTTTIPSVPRIGLASIIKLNTAEASIFLTLLKYRIPQIYLKLISAPAIDASVYTAILE